MTNPKQRERIAELEARVAELTADADRDKSTIDELRRQLAAAQAVGARNRRRRG